jgi:hypothetical protein
MANKLKAKHWFRPASTLFYILHRSHPKKSCIFYVSGYIVAPTSSYGRHVGIITDGRKWKSEVLSLSVVAWRSGQVS